MTAADDEAAKQIRVLNSKCLPVWARDGGRWALLAFQPTKYPG